jgi:hypothetical protein
MASSTHLHTTESGIRFDLTDSLHTPLRIHNAADGSWTPYPIDALLSEFSREEALDVLVTAFCVSDRAPLERVGDEVVWMSKQLSSLELVHHINGRIYRPAEPDEPGDCNGEVLSEELLSNDGTLFYEGFDLGTTDALYEETCDAFAERLTDAHGPRE